MGQDHPRDRVPDELCKGDQCKAIQHHGERITLGDSLTGEENLTRAILSPEDELGCMAVAVEGKPTTSNPEMSHSPQHCFPGELIEPIFCIHKKSCMWGWRALWCRGGTSPL